MFDKHKGLLGVTAIPLLHGAGGTWDEVILLGLLGAFVVSLVLRGLGRKRKSKREEDEDEVQSDS